MNQWTILTYLLAAGAAVLVFLKLVCDEIVVKNRVLKLRVEMAEEAREKARALREEALAAQQQESAEEVVEAVPQAAGSRS
jgi:hypothetical protein